LNKAVTAADSGVLGCSGAEHLEHATSQEIALYTSIRLTGKPLSPAYKLLTAGKNYAGVVLAYQQRYLISQ
jgi:hypothetical protein